MRGVFTHFLDQLSFEQLVPIEVYTGTLGFLTLFSCPELMAKGFGCGGWFTQKDGHTLL
jgi:hypothetical protein